MTITGPDATAPSVTPNMNVFGVPSVGTVRRARLTERVDLRVDRLERLDGVRLGGGGAEEHRHRRPLAGREHPEREVEDAASVARPEVLERPDAPEVGERHERVDVLEAVVGRREKPRVGAADRHELLEPRRRDVPVDRASIDEVGRGGAEVLDGEIDLVELGSRRRPEDVADAKPSADLDRRVGRSGRDVEGPDDEVRRDAAVRDGRPPREPRRAVGDAPPFAPAAVDQGVGSGRHVHEAEDRPGVDGRVEMALGVDAEAKRPVRDLTGRQRGAPCCSARRQREPAERDESDEQPWSSPAGASTAKRPDGHETLLARRRAPGAHLHVARRTSESKSIHCTAKLPLSIVQSGHVRNGQASPGGATT